MAVGDHVHVYVDVKRDDPVGRPFVVEELDAVLIGNGNVRLVGTPVFVLASRQVMWWASCAW